MSKVRKPYVPSTPVSQLQAEREAYLYVDFVCKDALMFLLICNPAEQAAEDVKISFSRELMILDGSKVLNKLSIFSKLRFLAPHKEIAVFLGPAQTFLSQFDPKDTEVTITITYRTEQKNAFKKSILHDLAIYLDLPTTLNNSQHD